MIRLLHLKTILAIMASGNINFINITVIISDFLFFGVAAFLVFTVKQQFKHQKHQKSQPMMWFIAYWFVSSSVYGIFVLLDSTSYTIGLLVSSCLLQLIPYLFIVSILFVWCISLALRLLIHQYIYSVICIAIPVL